MYHIHTTDSLVLKVRPVGEADALFELLTREYGLIYAKATGIRLQKSKLRYALQEFSFATVELVRGKEIWRIVGAKCNVSAYVTLPTDRLHTFAQLLVLVRRLVTGESASHQMYEDIVAAAEQLRLPETQPRAIELICAARILEQLGYFARAHFPEVFVDVPNQAEILEKEEGLVKAINKAIKASHL